VEKNSLAGRSAPMISDGLSQPTSSMKSTPTTAPSRRKWNQRAKLRQIVIDLPTF
jgi:hypothetical protein